MVQGNINFHNNCTKTKMKNPRKDIKELQKIHKRLREEYSTTIELHEKILILERIKTMKECITGKYKEGRSKDSSTWEDNRERQEYITTCDNDHLVKDIIKIRLATYVGLEKELSKRRRGHKMPQMQSKQKEYTAEHVLECQTAETVYKIRDNTPLINRQTY